MTLHGAKITCLNPNVVVQTHDIFTTGIIYMPLSLAYFASALRTAGAEVEVLDSFGESPNTTTTQGGHMYRGLPADVVIRRIHPDSKAVVVYAGQIGNHQSLVRMIQSAKQLRPQLPVIVMENTQAVTGYSLRQIQEELYNMGADFILTGEAEKRGIDLIRALNRNAPLEEIAKIDGIGFRRSREISYTPPVAPSSDLDQYAYPAWDLFPLKNYWSLHYSHGPFSTSRYLPILTSRGCPYPCQFCVIPETNARKWRARKPETVAQEMAFYYKTYGVDEFHVEDVDPTIDDARTRKLCEEIQSLHLPIIWKLSAGTKAESIQDEKTLELMSQAGCRYISISPESGSERVMKLIKKPFNIPHAKRLIRKMNSLGIRSQACFVLGYPGEEEADRKLSLDLIIDLTRSGVDEIAVFIITPIPGSAIYEQFSGYADYSDLTFSPSWRADYKNLSAWRQRFYRAFLINKFLFHPLKFMAQPFRFLSRNFETKMEMVPYRALHTVLLQTGLIGHRNH